MLPFTGSPQSWNELIASLPLPHLLQSWEWSQVKAKYGWQPMPFLWSDPLSASSNTPLAAAMILKRSIPLGGFAKKMCVLYIPKGPNLDWNDAVLRQRVMGDLQVFAKHQGAISRADHALSEAQSRLVSVSGIERAALLLDQPLPTLRAAVRAATREATGEPA